MGDRLRFDQRGESLGTALELSQILGNRIANGHDGGAPLNAS